MTEETLLDIGHHCTNRLQDTLSTDPAWPLEILRNTEVNKGRLNNPRRRRKHRGRRAGIRYRLRKRAHSPPLPSILLANVRSLENKMDDLRARISFQRDIRDCNIFCLTETWLTPSVPDTAVTPSDNFSVYGWIEQPRLEKPRVVECASWLTRNGVTPGISPFCRVPARLIWNTSPLSAAPFYLPREVYIDHRYCVYIPPQADTSLALSNSTTSSAGNINKHPDAACIIAGDFNKPTSEKSCPTSTPPHISCPTRGQEYTGSCYTQFKRCLQSSSHCRLLAKTQIMSAFFSHRNTNNGSLMNRRWRGKWRAGPPTLKLCYRRLLMTSTGTCSGRVHLTSANSRM